MSEAGYSARNLFRLIKRQYGTVPVIQIPRRQHNMRARYRDILDTPEGKALTKQRQAVERAFSRLKGQRSLNNVTTRGLRKVTLNYYLSILAVQAIWT